MNFAFPSKTAFKPRGLSILEVMLAVFILSVAALALLGASITSAGATRQSAEYAAAVSAARKKMEEVSSTQFASLVKTYGVGSTGTTFKVYLNEGTEYRNSANKTARGIELQGFRKVVSGVDNYDAGEIVIVTSESAAASTYAYACSRSPSDPKPDNGQPGGISFGGIPLDLNADGNTTSGNCYNLAVTPNVTTAVRLPVGVIVRWDGPHGPERYELWTILTIY
jgi:Tfp pilus assembly protein PilV